MKNFGLLQIVVVAVEVLSQLQFYHQYRYLFSDNPCFVPEILSRAEAFLASRSSIVQTLIYISLFPFNLKTVVVYYLDIW